MDSLTHALSNVTVTNDGQTVSATNIKYDETNISSGSVASGTFTLTSIQATIAGQEETIDLSEPVTVTTSTTLKVKTATEVENSVTSTQVADGYVNTIIVDDSVTGVLEVTNPIILPEQITMFDGKDYLKLGAVGINSDHVTVQNLVVSNLNRFGSNIHRGINYNGTGVLTINNVDVIIVEGSVGYPANAVRINQANATVTMTNSSIDFKLGRSSAPGTLTGIVLSADSTLTLDETPVSVEATTSSQPALGIDGLSGTINLINSDITVTANGGTIAALPSSADVTINNQNSTITP